MTEEAWLTCADLTQMLAWLKATGLVNERKQYRLDVALGAQRGKPRARSMELDSWNSAVKQLLPVGQRNLVS